MDPQTAIRKNVDALTALAEDVPADSLARWLEAYLALEATTAASSRKVQRRDMERFLAFMRLEEKSDERARWTPRLSAAFVEALRNEVDQNGRRRYADRTIARVLAHLKTWSKWVNRHAPFPLGDPMHKVKVSMGAPPLAVDRALTPSERRRLLDAADLLPSQGGRSRDRHRYRDAAERPQRRGYRPWRTRAIVYLLVETGMRRAAAVNADLEDVDSTRARITVREKGGAQHTYKISREGLRAVQDYVAHERAVDAEVLQSPALLLPAADNARSSGRLSPVAVNRAWNEVAQKADVAGKSPHSARHAMGRHVVQKTGNVAAVQRQLGHRNASYAMQYMRVSEEELDDVVNDRSG
jgi:site-specific recombinase XerD